MPQRDLMTPREVRRIADMTAEGLLPSEIARVLRRSPSTVKEVMAKMGLTAPRLMIPVSGAVKTPTMRDRINASARRGRRK